MSEQEVVKSIGATPVKNSGRGNLKGDFTWRDFVGDVKEGKSFTLNEAVWRKICDDRLTHGFGKLPMLLRVLPSGTKLAVISFSDLKYFLEEIDDLRDEVNGVDV